MHTPLKEEVVESDLFDARRGPLRLPLLVIICGGSSVPQPSCPVALSPVPPAGPFGDVPSGL